MEITMLVLIAGILFLWYRKFTSAGYNFNNTIFRVKYTHGHPDINKPSWCNLGFKNSDIYLLSTFSNEVAKINGKHIKNVIVEDETTFKEKVTLARMAMIGVFAFALKKKKTNELAYLTIEWNDGRFDNSTIFEYSGKGSFQKANRDRNKIMNFIR